MNIIYFYLSIKEIFRYSFGGDDNDGGDGVEHLLGGKCGLWDNRVDDVGGKDDVEDHVEDDVEDMLKMMLKMMIKMMLKMMVDFLLREECGITEWRRQNRLI